MKYLIANWKAHKSLIESEEWMASFKQFLSQSNDILRKLESKELEIIIAPSFAHLAMVKDSLAGLPNCYVAAQAVSSQKEGNFTGEVTAGALKGLADYSLVGHSERRGKGETVENIKEQLSNLSTAGIVPVLCVRTAEEFPQDYRGIVAYEPPSAIASSNNASLDEVLNVYSKLKLSSDSVYLYGGSVDENTCKEYLAKEEIRGFIVGTASLEVEQFMKIAACI